MNPTCLTTNSFNYIIQLSKINSNRCISWLDFAAVEKQRIIMLFTNWLKRITWVSTNLGAINKETQSTYIQQKISTEFGSRSFKITAEKRRERKRTREGHGRGLWVEREREREKWEEKGQMPVFFFFLFFFLVLFSTGAVWYG